MVPQPADPVPGVDRVRHHHVVRAEVAEVTRVRQQPGEAQSQAGPDPFALLGHPRPADRHTELAYVPGCRSVRSGGERVAGECQLGPGGRCGQCHRDLRERCADLDGGEGLPVGVEDAQMCRPRCSGTADVGAQFSGATGRDRQDAFAVRPDPLAATAAFRWVPACPAGDGRADATQQRAAGTDRDLPPG